MSDWLARFLAYFKRPPEPEEEAQLLDIPDGEETPSPAQVARAAGCPFPVGDGWSLFRDPLTMAWMRALRLQSRTTVKGEGGTEVSGYAGDYLICPQGQGRSIMAAADFEARFRPWSPGDDA